ncbi:MAG: hypothetical protein ONB43_24845 [candidate division KSB1 bacterium]|nr:hypothetical protein [candidate division KSB1 bacterium]
MDGRKISMMLALAVGVVMLASGIAVLTGIVLPPAAPRPLRLTLGIVFLLMGIYRLLMIRLQVKQAERSDE